MRLQCHLNPECKSVLFMELLTHEYKNTSLSDAFSFKVLLERDVKKYYIKEVSNFPLGYDLRER